MISLFLLASFGINAQNLAGVTGLFNIPSAEMMEEGTFVFGANMMDRNYGGFDYRRTPVYEWDALAVYGTVAFLPWIEGQFRWTHSIGREIQFSPIYAPDRMASLRVRLLKGRDNRYPSVVVGAEDPARFAGSPSPSYYASLYAVATQAFSMANWEVNLTLGYGFDPKFSWMVDRAQFLRQDGVFGGLTIGHRALPGSAIMLEYDSFRWNAGVRVLLFKHLQILAGIYEFKAFSGGLSYRISLWSE